MMHTCTNEREIIEREKETCACTHTHTTMVDYMVLFIFFRAGVRLFQQDLATLSNEV